MKKVVFVDRDGTIIREPRDKQIDSLEKLEFVPGIISGLKMLVDAGYTLVLVSNQDALGTARYPRKNYDLVQGKLLRLLTGEGIVFEKILVCPHERQDNCECRKPKLGLLKNYLKTNSLDLSHSFVLGDRETDIEFAANLGVRSVRLSNAKRSAASFVSRDALAACQYIARTSRSLSIERTTKETHIRASVTLDGLGNHEIGTGIHFFDHMLAQLARHSGIDIQLTAVGDIEVDAHHTVEDTAITLGEALRRALGDKRGIERFGFTAPLDEALAEVALDLSGRSFLSFKCEFKRETVGDLPTELVEDFFKAFADSLGASIHIKCSGRNDHHKIEAIFKATARALKQAVAIDSRARATLPSTKGKL
ncbi:MAG: bifunctional histidinol-phosphatase/imidazoleglycerol-phosphate dehydratase HisB [Acidobacteriota bacterium]